MIKKLMLVLLVLTLNVSVTAQDPDIYVWAGGEFIDDVWHDTMTVMPGEWFSVTVYMQSATEDDIIADFAYPLGIRYAYIDSFYTEDEWPQYPEPPYAKYPPFGGDVDPVPWTTAVFTNANGDVDDGNPLWNPPGYKSLSFIGFSRGPSPPFAPYFMSLVPIPCFTYYVHASDTVMPGQTICDALIEGVDPMCGPANAGPPQGAGFNLSLEYACVYFDNLPGHGSVTGSVTDIMNGTPVEDVHISVIDNTSRDIIRETWTGPDGVYAVAIIPFGYYDLQFEHPDYIDSLCSQYNVFLDPHTLDIELCPLAEEDIVFWYGKPGTSPIMAPLGELLNINVYIQTTETTFGADIHIPLGVQDQYFDGLLSETEGQYYYPFTAWDIAYFDVPHGSPPNPEGWSSQSFFAQASVSGNPWLNFATPTKAVTFVVSVVDNPSFAGDTVQCIGIGVHPDGRPLSVGDTLSGSYYPSVEYVSEVVFIEVNSAYLPGDASMYYGRWPPGVVGGDRTYLVGYFLGIADNEPCFLNGFWASADVNGDCQVIGSDVTRFVGYFLGNGDIEYCPDYEPLWPTPADVPEDAPTGWPYCE